MNIKTNPIPHDHHTITPYILVNDVARALEFYKLAFGAQELLRIEPSPGNIAHAELKIGDSIIMISGTPSNMNSANSNGTNRHISFMVYVADVDLAAKNAVDAGMKVIKKVQNQSYGDRTGVFEDPFGYIWSIGTHLEDVSNEETTKRMQQFCSL